MGVFSFVKAGKKIFGKPKSTGSAIKSVKPNVPKTRLEKAKSKLAIQKQKTKGAEAKLKQTTFELKNPKTKKDDKFTFQKSDKKSESNKEAYKRIQKENTESIKKMIDTAFAENKAKGGRVGVKGGSFPDLSGDGKTTFTDILIGRGVIKKGKKGKKTDTPIQKAVKKNKKKKRFV